MPYAQHFAIILLLLTCATLGVTQPANLYQSETLEVHKVTDHVYQHISFLDTESFGKVPCNGMIVVDQNEAIIFDTPTDTIASAELIDWVENELHSRVIAIVPTHFHVDCLGGLEAFHRQGIPSYASNKTIALARKHHKAIPQNGFDRSLTLKAGDELVEVAFVGEGHSRDNVVGYVPAEKVLFGGCLIKEAEAGKGNLEDANVPAWPLTVAALKKQYLTIETVIPGHGKVGGVELLSYTAKLFTQQK